MTYCLFLTLKLFLVPKFELKLSVYMLEPCYKPMPLQLSEFTCRLIYLQIDEIRWMKFAGHIASHVLTVYWFLFCRLAPMGFIQSTFSLLVGAAGGIYIAQNYDVPNIKNYMQGLMGKAKELDDAYKKPEDGSKSKA